MAVAKAHLMSGSQDGWDHDYPDQQDSPYRMKKLHTVLSKLEDEIRFLRQRMEKTILNEESLTSENVIKISRMLDEKINEYLIYKKKS